VTPPPSPPRRRRGEPPSRFWLISGIVGSSKSAKKLKFIHWVLLIATLVIGVWLRFDALTQDIRFHPDEALFATFARDSAVHGQWMFPGALDKPPLSLYAAALSMHAVGVQLNAKSVLDLDLRTGEFAARLPSVFAGIIAVALTYALAFTLSRQRDASLIAALLMALSPFHIAFSATAFTDPLMVTCGMAALVMAARGRPVWAGVCLALSVWSKQQGIFFLPLVLWMVFIKHHVGTRYSEAVAANKTRIRRTPYRVSLQFGLPSIVCLAVFLIGISLLLAWDAVRASSQNATSLFALAAVNNNPERTFIRLDELLPRLGVWGSHIGMFFGTPLMTFGLIAVSAVGVAWQVWRRLAPLIVFCVVYLVAHWLTAFNLYDRYLLPLVPLLAVIVGVGMTGWLSRIRHFNNGDSGHGTAVSLQNLLLSFVAGVMLISAYPAHYPTDDRARDSAIVDLGEHLNAKPLGAILYDPWLGWELGYYLGAWPDKRRVHYPAPDILANDALLNPDGAPRYFIAPKGRDVTPWIEALKENRFTVSLDWENDRYIVFEVLPPETIGRQSAK
jgi:4-amino-4-deoxy-L-arabinose transferase-like glycosyltransferase